MRTIDQRAGEVMISGGDMNQTAQFACSVPDFVLKGYFADLVKLDVQALDRRCGSPLEQHRSGSAA